VAERPSRPIAIPVLPEAIPEQLKVLPQWVTWRYVWREDLHKHDKPPKQARTGRAASTTDPKTWATFADALSAYERRDLDGIGLVVIEENEWVGVDLDHCRDPETGEIAPWAWAIVRRMNTYTEVSPSGTGLRLWLKGKRRKQGRRKGPIEVYSWGRYLTMTGWHLEGTPRTIEPRQTELDAWEAETFDTPPPPRAEQPSANGTGPSLSDDDLLGRALSARNASKFAALWSGDTSAYDDDDSRADLALCCELAFWTRDESQIDRLFRRSALYRSKWERDDYRDVTIAKALGATTEHWTPRPTPPVDHNPWAGMNTLPLRPYLGYRGITVRGGADHGR
jgi:putative DNA primase/helicase